MFGRLLSRIRNADKPKLPAVIVLGATGAGKSSFVHGVTGDSNAVVGHGLRSVTKDIVACELDCKAVNCYVLDTPGFDDSDSGHYGILDALKKWMGSGKSFAAIVILHPITENRLRGSTQETLRLIDKLCGRPGPERVLLVTTFWDQIEEADGIQREKDLAELDGTWKVLVERGCKVERCSLDHYHRFPRLLAKMVKKYQEQFDVPKAPTYYPPIQTFSAWSSTYPASGSQPYSYGAQPTYAPMYSSQYYTRDQGLSASPYAAKPTSYTSRSLGSYPLPTSALVNTQQAALEDDRRQMQMALHRLDLQHQQELSAQQRAIDEQARRQAEQEAAQQEWQAEQNWRAQLFTTILQAGLQELQRQAQQGRQAEQQWEGSQQWGGSGQRD